MNLLSRVGFSLATAILAAAPAAAQVSSCFFPFWGGYGAPMYGGGYAGYSPTWGVPAPMAMYSASYAPSAGCCVPSCCDPCGGCSTGACGVGATGTGTLKPTTDENFIEQSREKQEDAGKERTFGSDPDTDPNRQYQRERNPGDGFEPGTGRTRPDPRTPADSGWENRGRTAPGSDPAGAGGAGAGGSGAGAGAVDGADTGTDDGAFPPFPDNLGGDRSSNKPPMSDPATEATPAGNGTGDDGFGSPAADPAKDSAKDPADFLGPGATDGSKSETDPATGANPTAMRSQLREVVPSQRLAGRPARKSNSGFAGSQSNGKATRWISVPLPESHARL
ncbi:MAG: hypothetical protein JNL58_07680 [Planctomyces sp.]|nr:hypothetical protein [Planctomyces sp.]